MIKGASRDKKKLYANVIDWKCIFFKYCPYYISIVIFNKKLNTFKQCFVKQLILGENMYPWPTEGTFANPLGKQSFWKMREFLEKVP